MMVILGILAVTYLLVGLYTAIDDIIYYHSRRNDGDFTIVKKWPRVVKYSFFLGVLIVNLFLGPVLLAQWVLWSNRRALSQIPDEHHEPQIN